jgi:hypothetical protein
MIVEEFAGSRSALDAATLAGGYCSLIPLHPLEFLQMRSTNSLLLLSS